VPGDSAAKWAEVRNYVTKNVHRTTYPARGWDVGSGVQIAGWPEMRWEQVPSAQVAALKARYASGLGLW